MPEAPYFHETDLFLSGQGGYHTYRIPALVVTRAGTVLAFSEARKNSAADDGDIDLALRRSTDGGRTWSDTDVIADDGAHTMGNPCPVVARRNGTICLPLCRDNKRVLLMKSVDDGRTWSAPTDITDQAIDPAWHWVGTGPGHGIQLRDGRLIVPCWADATENLGETQFSFVLHSDDGGLIWRHGAAMEHEASDECEIVETAADTLYMNMRNSTGKGCRAFSRSEDSGATWSDIRFDRNLPDPGCQGSMVRLTQEPESHRDRVLFANAADPHMRARLTVRLSYDECRTWPVSRVVYEGSSMYSDLCAAADGHVVCMYEADNVGRIVLARFNVEWLTNGADSLT